MSSLDGFGRIGLKGIAANYTLCAVAGVSWYLQFFLYTMGSSKLGQRFAFSSWTVHMASIIIFSTIWGIIAKEWQDTSRRTHVFIGLGLAVLISSTLIIGYGNYLGGSSGGLIW